MIVNNLLPQSRWIVSSQLDIIQSYIIINLVDSIIILFISIEFFEMKSTQIEFITVEEVTNIFMRKKKPEQRRKSILFRKSG